MQQILAPHENVEKLCGVQHMNSALSYRTARFCLRLSCRDGELLYNMLTGKLVFVGFGEHEHESVADLIHDWFYVPVDFDERTFVDQLRNIKLLLKPGKTCVNSFTILPTTDCNARCKYCYERGRSRLAMSEGVAQQVASHIAAVCGDEDVSLAWFGGEPLYNMPAIDTVCKGLAGRSIPFSSHMTSNGYYLTPEIARHGVLEWCMRSVQITLDGTRNLYNRTKSYVDACGDPYLRVLNNVQGALDAGIKVILRLNMDRSNASDLIQLVEELGERFSSCEKLSIFVAPLHSFVGGVEEFATMREALQAYLTLDECIERTGLARNRPLRGALRTNRCMADNDSCEVILPDGKVGKCEHCSEKDFFGDVWSDERNEHMIAAWKEKAQAFDACDNCAFYPRCIMLAKCDWCKDGCSELMRSIRLAVIKKRMLKAYESWREAR